MSLKCTSCGEPNPEGARSCSICGAPLPTQSIERREGRRTVTVLLCDAVVTSSRSDAVDPERSHNLLERFFDDVRHAIETWGGVAAAGPGDTFQGVFGLPEMHEDDAAMAITAANEAIRIASSMTRDLSDQGLAVEAWVGVNTGEVVADPSDPGSVSGDPLSVAVQLEEVAGSGEILVGPVTRRLLEDVATTESVDPVEVPGLAKPIPAYRVTGMGSAPTGATRTPLIGRGRDSALIIDTFDRAVGSRSCHVVTVLGQAGLGKTRLIDEIGIQLGDRSSVLRASCPPYGRAGALLPVSDMLRGAAGITLDDTRAKARSKLAELVKEDETGPLVSRLSEVTEIAEATSRPEEIFWAVRNAFERLSDRSPLIVAFDALQHAQPTLIDLIEHVLEWTEDRSILLICGARPEFLDRYPNWGARKTNVATISLQPLARDEIGSMIEHLFEGSPVSEEIEDRIVRASGGNPLFIEQLASMLVDANLVAQENGLWKAVSDLARVPTTATALLGARLDGLDELERGVIQAAAVIGDQFELSLLAAVTGQEIAEAVRSLGRKELIRKSSSGETGHVYSFRDGLMREVAYGSLLKEDRAALHESVAKHLDGSPDGPGHEMAVAFHFEQAYLSLRDLAIKDAHSKQLGDGASKRLAKLGRAALARADLSTAFDLLKRALVVLDPHDKHRFQLSLDLCVAQLELGEVGDVDRTLKGLDALELDEAERTRADLMRYRAAEYSESPEEWSKKAADVAEKAVVIFKQTADDLALAESYELWGESHWNENRNEMAGTMYRRAFEHAEKADAELMQARLIGRMVAAAFWGPLSARDGAALCERIIADPDQNRMVVAKVLSFLGGFRAMLGDFVEARRLAAESAGIAHDLGMRLYLASSSQIVGIIEMLDDNFIDAERALRRSFEALEAMGEKAFIPRAALDLSVALLAQDRLEEAERLSATGRERATNDDVDAQVLWRVVRGQIETRTGNQDATDLVREAVDLAAGTDNLFLQANALATLGEVLATRGEIDGAKQALADALALYRAKQVLPAIDRTKKVLASLLA